MTKLKAHFMCGLMSDLGIYKFRKVWSCVTPNVLTETRFNTRVEVIKYRTFVSPFAKLGIVMELFWVVLIDRVLNGGYLVCSVVCVLQCIVPTCQEK